MELTHSYSTIRIRQWCNSFNKKFGCCNTRYHRRSNGSVNAQSVIVAQYSALETEINTSLGALGAEIRALKFQTDFLTTVNDSTEIGLGNIVDADLAESSAELTALQVRQQLGVQVWG